MRHFNTHISSILPGRNFGLDFIRATAILMVIVGHCYHFFEPWFPKIHRLAFITGNGVELFFALSGFLIGGILIRQFSVNDDRLGRNLITFWKRRWIRTIPVYWLAVVVNYFTAVWITTIIVNSGFPFSHFTFTQALHSGGFWFFPASYSLCIEEWFYLLFPLLFTLLCVLFSKQKRTNILLVTGLLFIATGIIFRTLIWDMYPEQWDPVFRKGTILRIDACVYGVLAAIAFNRMKEKLIAKKYALLIAGIILYTATQLVKYKLFDSYITFVLYFGLIPVSFALMIPFFYAMKVPKRKSVLIAVTAMSVTSYALYLFHLSPFNEIATMFSLGSTFLLTCTIVVTYLVIILVWSWLWYRYIETPIVRLRE